MKLGTLYGIGVGPGDPELMTVKGARLLSRCRHVFVPKSGPAAESVALEIARAHVGPVAESRELVFPMTTDPVELERKWLEAGREVAAVLQAGEDACFITLGDPLLYSTYIYLVRALRTLLPELVIETVPGVTSVAAAAALAEFPVGVGKRPITIVPTADDLDAVRAALRTGGTVVLMKIGKRLAAILDLLDAEGLLERAAFVARAGQDGQRIEHDLRRLREEKPEAGYLSIILVDASKQGSTATEL